MQWQCGSGVGVEWADGCQRNGRRQSIQKETAVKIFSVETQTLLDQPAQGEEQRSTSCFVWKGARNERTTDHRKNSTPRRATMRNSACQAASGCVVGSSVSWAARAQLRRSK